MKNKVKQMVCMACAFVLSFMLTVTAFADSTFVIQNDNYFGYYNAVNNPAGMVTVREEYVKMGVYENMFIKSITLIPDEQPNEQYVLEK